MFAIDEYRMSQSAMASTETIAESKKLTISLPIIEKTVAQFKTTTRIRVIRFLSLKFTFFKYLFAGKGVDEASGVDNTKRKGEIVLSQKWRRRGRCGER